MFMCVYVWLPVSIFRGSKVGVNMCKSSCRCVCVFLEGSEEWVHVRILVCLLKGRIQRDFCL